LFEYGPNGDIWGAEEDHLARMTESLGETFDPSFLAKCEHSAKFFRPDGKSTPGLFCSHFDTILIDLGSFAHFTVHEEPTWPLEEFISKLALLKEDESAEDTARFLRRCLRLRPEDRATARELLDDPWLAGVDDI
jgi:serine/threonine-protein kinase SRPK3